jgi:hypothetical protein
VTWALEWWQLQHVTVRLSRKGTLGTLPLEPTLASGLHLTSMSREQPRPERAVKPEPRSEEIRISNNLGTINNWLFVSCAMPSPPTAFARQPASPPTITRPGHDHPPILRSYRDNWIGNSEKCKMQHVAKTCHTTVGCTSIHLSIQVNVSAVKTQLTVPERHGYLSRTCHEVLV